MRPYAGGYRIRADRGDTDIAASAFLNQSLCMLPPAELIKISMWFHRDNILSIDREMDSSDAISQGIARILSE